MPVNTGGIPAGGVTSATTSAGGVCWIGGADEASQIQSLTERVAALERALALLIGGDVEAGQLSSLSQQIGWVHGITYMGEEGWTRTEAGTLIPAAGVSFSTLGFTLSDGNTYPMVVMDEDGVLQYGFTNTGEITGRSAPSGTALFQSSSGSVGAGPGGTNLTWTTIEPKTFAINNSTSIALASGLYLITLNSAGPVSRTSTVGDASFYCTVGTTVGNNAIQAQKYWEDGDTDTISDFWVHGALVARFPDSLGGSTITGLVSEAGTPPVVMAPLMLGIMRLGS